MTHEEALEYARRRCGPATKVQVVERDGVPCLRFSVDLHAEINLLPRPDRTLKEEIRIVMDVLADEVRKP